MPSRLRTACTYPGCPLITTGGRCDKHQREQTRRYEDNRLSAAKRGYGKSWQGLRLLVLREEPLCRECDAPATDVDHIDGDVTNMARENLQALCHACHSRKTTRENGGGWGRHD